MKSYLLIKPEEGGVSVYLEKKDGYVGGHFKFVWKQLKGESWRVKVIFIVAYLLSKKPEK